MKRGEIWWADLGQAAGRRPVLLLSRNEAYAVRRLVTVAPLTSRVRHIASEVPLGKEDGVPKACVVNLDTISTIDRSCLEGPLTSLSARQMRNVDDAVHFSLGLKK